MKFLSHSALFILLICLVLSGCEKRNDNKKVQYDAKIVGFDPNCGTCILSFPNDSLKIKNELGISLDSYYEAVNLNQWNYAIGQKLKVEVRKAEDGELNACITLYPSSNYKSIYVSDIKNYNNLRLNDTIEISYKDCLYDPNRQFYICLDSVISDSRCPDGVECVWAGEATARFKIEKFNCSPVFFVLKEGAEDTVIEGIKVSFLKLLPYPKYGTQIRPENYKARIIVK